MFGMNLPHPRLVLELFERLSGNSSLWNSLRPEGPAFSRRRIYSLGVVVRLMILQRVLPAGTLGEAVQYWLHSQGATPKRAISPRAGAYCRARQKLPTLVAVDVFELIVQRLRGWLPPNPVIPTRPVFVLDGTTLTLPHAPALVRAYPPSRNQYGESHWPIIRLVVLQDVQTGLALRPHWGPHHGPHAIGEQALALQGYSATAPAICRAGRPELWRVCHRLVGLATPTRCPATPNQATRRSSGGRSFDCSW